MTFVYLAAVFFLSICIFHRRTGKRIWNGGSNRTIWLIVLAAFLVRIGVAAANQGFPTDIACFYSWANMAYENGLGSFYTSGVFTDYPPGYVCVLYVLGFLLSVFKADYLSTASLLILKLPAILCDLATGLMIYKMARERQNDSNAVVISVLYLLNPAVILNSCVWGQVDAVLCFFVVLLCRLLMKKKMILSYLAYAAGVLLKPQMLIFTPVLIYGTLENVILHDFSMQKFLRNLFGGLAAIAGMIVVCIPFGLENIIHLYTSTLESYPYVTVNAYNFWAFLGKNWTSQEERLLFMSYQNWGTLNILLAVALSAFFFFRAKKKESRYFTTAALLIISVFLFSVRMHERYLFPAMALLLLAYAVRPLKGFLASYAGVTLIQLYNTADVLFSYSKEGYVVNTGMLRFVSAAAVLIGVYFCYKLYYYDIRAVADIADRIWPDAAVQTPDEISASREKQEAHRKIRWKNTDFAPRPSQKKMKFCRKDAAVILAITLIYSVFALYDLGDTEAPQSEYHMQKGEMLTLEVPEGQQVSWLYWYLGYLENREFFVEYRLTAESGWEKLKGDGLVTMYDVFKWGRVQVPEGCRYLRLTCMSEEVSIMELALADGNETAFMPQNAQSYPALFDENSMFPAEGISFRNGTYFDEIYHARTGYEFLHGLRTYETTHPPLGKVLISAGIALFGMTPFGWRIAGTVFGILMLPVIYLFARDISRSRLLGGFASVLLAADFMHFAQTRIATIDVYVTFFILLMYYFMYRYTQMSFYDTPLRKTFLPLGACGVTMGLAVASKWTGVYAGVGLAVIFFASLCRRYQEYRYAKENPSKCSGKIRHEDVVREFRPHVVSTIKFCLLFFVAVPVLIYILSYIPFKSWDTGLLSKMWNNQIGMLSYHAGLEAEHPFSSPWYEWPVMIRPILYYAESLGGTLRQSISAFGNPLVWWTGILALIYLVYLAAGKKDKTAMFLGVGYLAEYLPWCLVPRITFIYHYFPSVPFVVLALMYCAKDLRTRLPERKWHILVAGYAAAATGLFLLFYPVISGQTVSGQYVDTLLRWMDSWVL